MTLEIITGNENPIVKEGSVVNGHFGGKEVIVESCQPGWGAKVTLVQPIPFEDSITNLSVDDVLVLDGGVILRGK